jgi:hypothetical protein
MSVYQKYYQENADKRMEQYAYAPPPDFRFEADGIISPVVQDFRTVERYKEYKECGFDILLAQTSGVYNGEPWEISKTKLVLDRAYEAGLKKVIVTDERIRLLSETFDGLIGEGKKFASEEELIEFVRAEHRRELCFEGHRWFDLRRWGMPSFTHKWHDNEDESSTFCLEEADLLYTVPIPDEALEMNPSLEQNKLPGKRLPID